MVPPSSGVMDSSQLLHTLKIEAEQLESAIRITYNKSFEASHPDRIYKLMHEEYTRLCKLRKMKEFQICMLLGNIFNQPQQQASFQTTQTPNKKRRLDVSDDSPVPSPDNPDYDINKEAAPQAQPPYIIDLINPVFKAPAKSNAVDPSASELEYWQRPRLGGGFD